MNKPSQLSETSRFSARSVTVTVLRPLVTLLAIAASGCVPQTGEEVADGPDAGMTGSGSGSGSSGVDAMEVPAGPFPLDCAVPANQMTLHCGRPSAQALGSIGSGPPTNGKLNGGFVDAANNRLIAAVEYSNTPATGYVLAVDLATGTRSIISGYYNDAANGRMMIGSGPDWGTVKDVQPGGNGMWFANTSVGVYRIDPANGTRTLVIDHANTATRCTVGTTKAIPRKDELAVGPDNAIYLALSNSPAGTGVGLVKVKGGVCTIVSLGGGPSGSAVGSGATFTSGYLRTIRFRDGKIWGLEFQSKSLMTIDPATGARVRVSSSGVTKVGTGTIDVGSGHLTFPMTGATPVWTSLYDTANQLTTIGAIDPATGNRTQVVLANGPANKGGASYPGLWTHPTKEWLLIGLDDSIIQVDIGTGASYTLSR